ncbi:unnamed protein product [Didymodactylos carnosus]|uniref:Uncharacterized protein n=1 Tax=Didymodactylos carnosus TaxID=1234261 RepID=A0A8S2UAA1_9BILA|nr:unnamed protein product [Didymodactylos carnosus]CAF4333062.1 unnamed protein product [Didymodactylos carnosus]
MDRAGKKLVRETIGILKKLHPGWEAKRILSDIKPMLEREQIPYSSSNSLLQNIKYQLKKFRETETTTLRRSGSGRPPTKSSKQLSIKLKRLVLNKRRRSPRKVAPKVDASVLTALRNLKKFAKPHRRKTTTKITNEHLMKRKKFALWLKRHWKLNPHDRSSKWQRLVNTYFSKPFRLTPELTSKNDIIWSTSRQDADKHGGYHGREKFSPGIMLWGGISWNGLIPPEAPVFIDKFLDGYQWPKRAKKTINGARYADLISTIGYPSLMKKYRNRVPIFQDDAASIHRTPIVLQQIDALFNERIPVDVQSPKFDDIWAIETV